MLLSRTKFLKHLETVDYVKFANLDLDWTAIQEECQQAVIDHPNYWSCLVPEGVEHWEDPSEDYLQDLQKFYTMGYNKHNTRTWETTAHRPQLKLSWQTDCENLLPVSPAESRPTCQPPGNTMPWHIDNFHFWKRNYPTSEHIIRFIVFQEDWKHGQIIQAGSSIISHWQAGDAVTWHPTRWHLSTNAGVENKWTTAVTGILLEEFEVDQLIFNSHLD